MSGGAATHRTHRVRWVRLLLFSVGWMVAATGASCAPWIERPAAALVLTAPDLAEFVKFLPEVRDGTLGIQRLFFLAPLFLLTLGTPLALGSGLSGTPSWLRLLTRLAVFPLALMLLPPVWSPTVMISEEFRLQTLGCIVCIVLAIVWRSNWRLPRYLLALLSLGWVVAPLLAIWQFVEAQPAIARAYASAITLGWGVWATVGGGVLMSFIILWLVWRDANHCESR